MFRKPSFFVFLIVFGIVLTVVYNYSSDSSGNHIPKIILGGKEFLVEIADTREKYIRGLSGRNSLDEDKGMLFLFDKLDTYGFWMKDMKFPIDIIWINGDKVVYVLPTVNPGSYPNIFTPPVSADKVLEINAGLSRKFDITEGAPFILK